VHSPMPSRSGSVHAGSPLEVSSMHPSGLVAAPTRPQPETTPGHSLLAVHAAPTLVPPRHRLPPQIGPMGPAGSGQSAFTLQGSAAALLQVSQKHRAPAAPEHDGFAAESVLVEIPVDTVIGVVVFARLPRKLEVVGGQSKLDRPKSGRPAVASAASHPNPARGPASQVPPFTVSLGVRSPTQRGQGPSVVLPR